MFMEHVSIASKLLSILKPQGIEMDYKTRTEEEMNIEKYSFEIAQ